jgi:tetratricopeptide (TPR) repeat protein
MIERGESETRDMLPRWLPLEKAMHTGEFSSSERIMKNEMRALHAKSIVSRAEEAFRAAKNAWLRDRGEIEAQELIAAAVVFGSRDDATEDAARLLLESSSLSPYMRPIILSALGEDITVAEKISGQFIAATCAAIAQHKRRLSVNPHDALSATEMALFYMYLGQSSTARKALERAVLQAPNNRYVLRALARLAAHENEPDLGLHYLKKSARSDFDPWLVAARLALIRHSGRAPARWRQTQNMANSDSYHPRSISELSAQLATLSAESGSRKQAIRLLGRSAISPTENTIAQLEHMNRKYSIQVFEEKSNEDPVDSDEAIAHRMLFLGQITRAVEACGAWSNLEPFSLEPAILGSFIACLSESSISQGIDLLNRALISNPFEETLLNNKAVLLSLADRPDEALESISQCRPSPDDDGTTFWATSGLIAMRSGKFDEGSSHYEKAISIAKGKKRPLVALRAFLFFAREVIRCDPRLAVDTNKVVEASFKKLGRLNVRVPIDLVLLGESIENSSKSPAPTGLGTFCVPSIDPVDLEDLA